VARFGVVLFLVMLIVWRIQHRQWLEKLRHYFTARKL
jgi:hypothetical protein